MEQAKRKQKRKKGHVIRVNPELWNLIHQENQGTESISKTLQRLLQLHRDPEEFWLLPQSLLVARSVEAARGMAILRCVQKGKKDPVEEPIRVLKAPA